MTKLMQNVTIALGAEGNILLQWSAPTDMTVRAMWPSIWENKAQGAASKWNGTLSMQLQEHAEHEVVFKKLDGMAMQIIGRMTTVKVNNNMGVTFVHAPSIGDSPASASGS